jgi:hypothetical protein
MSLISESGKTMAKGTAAATISLTDTTSYLTTILPPPSTSFSEIPSYSDYKILDVTGIYSDFTIVTTDGSATLDYDYGKYFLPDYLGGYIWVVDSAGKKAKGWVKAGVTGTKVSIVSTFGGTTQNWASIDSGFSIASGTVRVAVFGTMTNTAMKNKEVTIRDSGGKQIVGYVGDPTDSRTTWIVNAKGGSTQSWKYKDADFNTGEASYSIAIKETNAPVLVASGSITRNNTRLSLADYTNPFAWLSGVTLSDYADGKHVVKVFDSAGKVVSGYLSSMTSWAVGKTELASGGIAAGYLMEITATEANHFYTGCAIGEYFMSDGTETFDANNKAYYYYSNPNGSIMITGAAVNERENQLPYGMTSWLKADTIVQDDETALSLWFDSSGNNNHFGNSTAETQPIYYETTYTAGNRPTVGFSAHFLGNISFGLGTTFHVFMVLTQGSLTNNPAYLAEYEAGVDGVLELGASTAASPYLSIGDVDVSQCVSSFAQAANFYDVIEYQLTAGTWIIRKNGSYYTGNPGSPTRKDMLMIGGAKAGAKHLANMLLSEVIIYKRYLTDAEQTQVRKYLGDKYALGNWTWKDSGFNTKDTSGYTYKIYRTQ